MSDISEPYQLSQIQSINFPGIFSHRYHRFWSNYRNFSQTKGDLTNDKYVQFTVSVVIKC